MPSEFLHEPEIAGFFLNTSLFIRQPKYAYRTYPRRFGSQILTQVYVLYPVMTVDHKCCLRLTQFTQIGIITDMYPETRALTTMYTCALVGGSGGNPIVVLGLLMEDGCWLGFHALVTVCVSNLAKVMHYLRIHNVGS